MRTIKRSVAVVRPKSPLATWANRSLRDQGFSPYTSDYYTEDCVAFLIPPLLSKDGTSIQTMGWRYIDSSWEALFSEMLRRHEKEEWRWPQNRTRKMFGQWFKVEFFETVIDAVSPWAE